MPPLIVPDSFVLLLAAFQPCFTAPTFRTFRYLVAGWVQCPGRRTVTAVALAAGVVGWWHISVAHRFFSRARWAPDALGQVVFTQALRWLPPDQPLVLLVDDTLARKQGKAIALGSMHHDPLRSTARKPFSSFGHVWVVLALWVPLPFGPQGRPKGLALPLLFRLFVGSQRGNRRDAPSRPTSGARYRRAQAAFPTGSRPTKPALARELIARVAQWVPDRTLYVVGDTGYTNRTLLEDRPPNVQVVGRLRPDAALWTLPPPRRPGQRGRPRRRGTRLPTPQAMAAGRRVWHRLRVTLYGRAVTPLVFRGTALWYSALRAHPVRFVVVRDPNGRRRDEAFCCTDTTVSVAFLLTTYATRWSLEVTFFDCKQALGFEEAQTQALLAVRRTAPFAGLVYALVVLWAAQQVQAGQRLGWPTRPWYRHKTSLSFHDLLTALRQAGLARLAPSRLRLCASPCSSRRPHNPHRRRHSPGCVVA